MHPNFPNELLGEIFSHLLEEDERDRREEYSLVQFIDVRLVCRLWNQLATKYIFDTVLLWHTVETIGEDFITWHKLLDSKDVSNAVRRVAIKTGPDNDNELGGCEYWQFPSSWTENGEWPAFEAAINKICDLPNLERLEVRFTGCCVGKVEPVRDDWNLIQESLAEPEPTSTRFQTLRLIMNAIQKRARRSNMRPIRELVLENLQNIELPADIENGLFQGIQRLHIRILSECDNGVPMVEEHEKIYKAELVEFPYYLQTAFLPLVSDQLVELTLSGLDLGSIPKEFNGQGLLFPRLKTLTLDGLRILRRDQFDWVLEQKSLTRLRLHNCIIGSHCLVMQPEFSLWGVDLKGWSRVADGPPDGFYMERLPVPHTARPGAVDLEPGWYINTLRWDALFDDIRENLPLLKDFAFDRKLWSNYVQEFGPPYSGRYMGFAQCWFFLNSNDNHIQHWGREEAQIPGEPQRFSALAEPADRQALERLDKEIRHRL
ncbi:hypothetical protein FLONG3_5835 [Fusarium longipes]|uniref:Uncharacterized protein n=1 Tax=Fusarium longipes TaxID=694270 RepID=A0A395SRR0_9HYPO|nr:hypothetical protein FLONG3_5835 [Fusarium longipes]